MTTVISNQEFYDNFPIDISGFLPPISPGFPWAWSWTHQDDNGNPISTAGWSSEMDLRDSVNGQLFKKLSTAAGGIVNDNNGKFSVALAAVDSAKITSRVVVTNVKVVDAGGTPNNQFEATIPVKDIVTK